MNPSAARKGASFAGAVGYITHDPGARTSERVALVETLNLRTADPAKAAKVMAWTAYHAGELKQASGLAATGRKTENPVYHFSLNWEPGEAVSPAEMTATAKSAIAALGYSEHEAVLAAHDDKPHKHIHIVLNRIHPATGKTNNPKDDYEALQRWAYAYEKERGRVVCLDRAIKYEKDKSLLAGYKQQLAQQKADGTAKESKPRPQWKAEKGATHPQSEKYLTLRQVFAASVKSLAETGRMLAETHREQWAVLKMRHAAERGALWEQNKQAYAARAQTPSPAPYSWADYQGDRDALQGRHAADMRALRVRLREQDRPAVDRFFAGQKVQWRDFYRLSRAGGLAVFMASLEATIRTPLAEHGRQERGRFGRFIAALLSKDRRVAEFAERMETEKKQFFAGLDARQAPATRALVQRQRAELATLRTKFDAARNAIRQRAEAVAMARDSDRKERAGLSERHTAERKALTDTQERERGEFQGQWSKLNADRGAAWKGYKQHRQGQAKDRPPAAGGAPGGELGRDWQRAKLIESFEPERREEAKVRKPGRIGLEPGRER